MHANIFTRLVDFQYFYSGIPAVERLLKDGSEVRMALALSAIYAAHKYSVDPLQTYLLRLIQRNTTAALAILVLPFAEFYGWNSTFSKCWSIIERETKGVLESKHFNEATWDTICSVLENGRLTVNEFTLFSAVHK